MVKDNIVRYGVVKGCTMMKEEKATTTVWLYGSRTQCQSDS